MPRSLNKRTIDWEDLGRKPGRIHALVQKPIVHWSPCIPADKRGWVRARTLGNGEERSVAMPVRFSEWWKLLIFSLLCWRRNVHIYWQICCYISRLGDHEDWLAVFDPLVKGQSRQWKFVCFAALVKSANRYNWYLNALAAVVAELEKPQPTRRVNGRLRGKTYPVFLEYIVRERWDLYDPDDEVEDNRICAQYDPFAHKDIYGT